MAKIQKILSIVGICLSILLLITETAIVFDNTGIDMGAEIDIFSFVLCTLTGIFFLLSLKLSRAHDVTGNYQSGKTLTIILGFINLIIPAFSFFQWLRELFHPRTENFNPLEQLVVSFVKIGLTQSDFRYYSLKIENYLLAFLSVLTCTIIFISV